MPGDMKLTFDFRMEGADQVSRTMRGIAQDLNNIPKAAQDGLKQLGDNINSILKSLNTISSAQSGLSGLDKSMQSAFGAAQVTLVRNLKREIEDLEKHIGKLGERTTYFNLAAKKAKERGLVKAAERPEALAAEAAMEQYAAQQTLNDSRAELAKITGRPKFGPGTQPLGPEYGPQPAGVTGGKPAATSNELKNLLGPILSGLGITGSAATLITGAALPFAIGTAINAAVQNAATGGVRSDIAARRYSELSANDILNNKDPLRNILRAYGLGPEGEYLRGTGSLFSTVSRGANAYARGAWSAVTGQGFNTGYYNYMTELSNLGKEEFEDFDRVRALREQFADQGFLPESVAGQGAARAAFTDLAGRQLDPATAFRVLNLQARFGGVGGGADAAFAGLMAERYGISDNLTAQLFRRSAFMARTGIGGSAGGDVSLLLGQAGLGRQQDFAARAPFTEALNQELQQRGYVGDTDISNFGQGLAGAVRGAQGAVPGIAAIDAVAQGTQQAQAESRGLDTAFDPRRIAAIGSLVNAGLSYAEADVVVRLGVTNPDIQRRVASVLKKRTGRDVNVGGLIGGAEGQLRSAFRRALGQRGMIGEEFNQAFGGGTTGQDVILFGGRSIGQTQAFAGAAQGYYEPGAPGTPAQPAARTTRAEDREVNAEMAKSLSAALVQVGAIISQAMQGQLGPISKNVDHIAQIMLYRNPNPDRTFFTPGEPFRGGNK